MKKTAKKIRLALVLSAVLFVGALQAATIANVQIQSTAPNVDPEALQELVLGQISSKIGTEYSPKRVTDDIKNLMKSGSFEDVVPKVDKLPNGDIELTLVVMPKRRVREFIFTGNKKFKEKKLRSLLTHAVNAPLDEENLSQDSAAMNKKYQESGYYAASVVSEIVPIPNTSDVKVIFTVTEGSRSKLKKVTFEGNTIFKDRFLRKTVKTKRQWWRYIFRWGNYFNRPLLAFDKDLLREKYTEKGYLDFKVTEVEEVLSKNGKWISLNFKITEGQPYTVSAIKISGSERFSEEKLLESVSMKAGTIFNSAVETKDTKKLRHQYEPLGYLDLRCYPVHDLDTDKHEVVVEYKVHEGTISRIRDVFIVGNNVTRDNVIRRELAIHPGDLGDAGKIRSTKSRLENLNYFEKIEITPVATEQDNLRDLRIQLAEKRTGNIMLGGGFSSEDSLVAYVELSQTNFAWDNWPTFRGGGQRFRIRAQLGTDQAEMIVSFTEPWWLDKRIRLDLEAFYNTRSEDEFDEIHAGFSAMVTKGWRNKYWKRAIGLRIDRVSIEDFDDELDANPLLGLPLPSRLLVEEDGRSEFANRFVFNLTRDSRNRFMFPSQGSKLSLNAEIITALLGSYSNYYRLTADGSKYYPVFKDSTLKLRGKIGLADVISGDDIAVFDRFFAGGPNSIRGFERREVGPVDDDVRESAYGGCTQLIGTVELIKPLAKWVRVSAFSDFGNVYEDAFDFGTGINVSVGVGLQLQLPIGPLRFDYGFPIVTDQKHLSGNGGRLHFNLGYNF